MSQRKQIFTEMVSWRMEASNLILALVIFRNRWRSKMSEVYTSSGNELTGGTYVLPTSKDGT